MKKFGILFLIILAGVAAVWFLISHKVPPVGRDDAIDTVGGLIDPPMPPLPDITETRAVYITASTAESGNMDAITELIKKTEGDRSVNAVVIDIQDGEGHVILNDRIKALVRRLRFLKIFPIARVVVFQNNSLAQEKPDWAIKKANGQLWKDHGGRHWLDPSNKALWQYIASIASEAITAGFGEGNFDYFRFPSEGVDTAVYPLWHESELKTAVINNAAKFLRDAIKKDHPEIKVTADIFGYTFMRRYDLGIGQSAPALAAIFDEICPMIYPSHYDSGNFNFQNPAAHPYDVVFQTLEKGKEIFTEAQQPFTNIRPWIQDFDLGAVYTVDMVQAQMKAITDAGLHEGWLIWNPHNKYRSAIFAP